MSQLFEKTLIPHTKWEKRKKREFQEQHSPFQTAVENGNDRGYDFNGFSQDLFSALYQTNPQFPEASSMGTQWQKNALDSMKDLREYKDLRNMGTVCDAFQAGLGASVMADHFAKNLPEMTQPNPDDIQQQIDWYKEMLENAQTPEQKERFEDELQRAQRQQGPAQEAWGQVNTDEQAVRIAMRSALSAAREQIEEAEEMANAFGYGTETGQDGYTSPEAKLRIAEMVRNNSKLQEIAKLAGRFRREARAVQSQKKTPGPDELTDVEVGNDLGRLVPSELMKLSHPLMRMEFAKKYLERSLIQYHMESVEKEAQGPVVICIDSSGSMEGPKEVWSKAVALALCQIAVDQKRAFTVVHFDAEVKRTDRFPSTEKVNPERLLESMSYFANGPGTKFEPPLAKAFVMVNEEFKKENKGKADVIFITDGLAAISDTMKSNIVEAKKITGAKLFGICIGKEAPELKKISDHYTSLKDLAEDNELKETVFSI